MAVWQPASVDSQTEYAEISNEAPGPTDTDFQANADITSLSLLRRSIPNHGTSEANLMKLPLSMRASLPSDGKAQDSK